MIIIFLIIILFLSNVHVVNTLNNPVKSDIDVYLWKIKLFSANNNEKANFILPIGYYSIKISSEGYEDKVIKVINFNPFRKMIKNNIIIEPSIIDINSLSVFDPTGTIKLSPFVSIKGTNILGEEIQEVGLKNIVYGVYNATLTDPHFVGEIKINGSNFYQYNSEITSLKLNPGQNTRWLDKKDVDYVRNYVHDFLNLSSLDYIKIDKGFPKQFYLTDKKLILSLGDIIFIVCESELYNQQKNQNPIYFVPSNKKYTVVENNFNVEDCYANALAGYIPSIINNTPISKVVGNYEYYIYVDEQLNKKSWKNSISFTFDIESGRYINEENKGDSAISPCKNKITKLGIDKEDLICDNADDIGWFSSVEEHTYSDYPYPWVSGIKGTDEILTYSEKYGVPLTFYVVDRQINVFDLFNTSLNERIYDLVSQDLIEIGSHTVYHTNLNSVDKDESTRILQESKAFLEEKFNTTVTGLRGPYMSITNRDLLDHEIALRQAGYKYYAQDFYEIKALEDIKSKPWSYVFLTDGNQGDLINKIDNWAWVATLDHPWNHYYDGEYVGEDIKLKENPKRAIEARAMVLIALSNGAIPKMFKDVEIKEAWIE